VPRFAGTLQYVIIWLPVLVFSAAALVLTQPRPSKRWRSARVLLHSKVGRYPSSNSGGCGAFVLDPIRDLTWGEFVFVATFLLVLVVRFSLYVADFPKWSRGESACPLCCLPVSVVCD
jgi:hypothetical protein